MVLRTWQYSVERLARHRELFISPSIIQQSEVRLRNQGRPSSAAERLENVGEKIPCTECGKMILPSTAEANGGLCAPCKRGFRKNIEDGKVRQAEQKQARANPDPATRYWRSLVKQVSHSPGGFAGLSAENQTYFAVCLLEGEVYNGGFHQYFDNSSGDYYTDAMRGLEQIGAAECQRILIAAKVLLFGEHGVPDTRTDRFEYLDLEGMEPAREKELKALDRAFWAEGAKLRDLLSQYARKHCLFGGC
jgi:hypothetical protein